jgi:multidrug resistance efflux pump
VVQVAPQVEGQVVRVHVTDNELVREGALLFEIDPRPFAHRVQQLQARVAQNIQRVAEMESELRVAQAEEARIAAEESFARAVHEQEAAIFKKDATTERKYLDAVQKYKAAQALREQSRAEIQRKEEALRAMVGDQHALVAAARAEQSTAALNLEWTKVLAPARGYVTNLQLRVGAYVRIGQPVLTCIEADNWWIVANFRENNLEFVRPGQPAQIAFKALPGRRLPATVRSVGWGVAEGQGVPSGELPAIKNPHQWVPLPQRFQVRLTLDDPDALPPRVGATGSVVIYTDPEFPLNPVADAMQQLEAWFFLLR